MRIGLLTVALDGDPSVVAARQRARFLAAQLGFDRQDQTRLATAVSEIARNAWRYAGGGRVDFAVEGGGGGATDLAITVSDRGPGIAELDSILAGDFNSRTGMGIGLAGARRLVDRMTVNSLAGEGTTVSLFKRLPRGSLVDGARASAIASALARESPPDARAEAEQQNRELIEALAQLQARQDEMERLNHELEDTNRGVVALYAELDERAEALRKANEIQAQFLSYMSHEFRTPLDSILFLSQMLLERRDGDLGEEQERQVQFIGRSARELLALVDDLLETARADAGRTTIRPARFEIEDLFSAVRGLLKPLQREGTVPLTFEPPPPMPALYTDEARLSQVVRNFITNALKFTESGEVVVRAWHDADSEEVGISVTDTGIGIAADDVDRIFRDFAQVEGPVQRRVRGTGLGLPLSRRLVDLLGGRIEVDSEPDRGSTFTVLVPRVYLAADSGEERGMIGVAEGQGQ